MVQTRTRPLSPHLQIWKWGPHMLVSILHRMTGVGMATVGVAAFTWWLVSLAAGEAAYNQFLAVARHPLALIVPIGLTWAFFQHMSTGIRHWFLDIGANYELKANKGSSMGTIIASVLLTAAVWGLILFGKGLAL